MPNSYPFYHSLVEQLATKVITRIAQDGVSMEDAIKEIMGMYSQGRLSNEDRWYNLKWMERGLVK